MTAPGRRLRIAWVEEWMSTLAREVLPDLSRRHDIIYVTAGETVPEGRFAQVLRARPRRHMNLAGFALARLVNRLHRRGEIDLAAVWASVGFALRGVPFVNFEGTSVYAEIGLFAARTPWPARARFLPGLLHYAVPEMLCNRRAARVVTPSQALKRDIVRLHRIPGERVLVVPHGVEPGHLAIRAGKRPAPRTRILYVGRLHFRKGILEALREFIGRRDIDAELHVAGEGPDRVAMERLAAADPRVRLWGHLERRELEALLRTTTIFVLPTWYEGFGLALLEAMASGHACIAYDIPVVREVMGDTGVLVPAGNAAALVDAAARLARDPEAVGRLAELAHVRAARFSWRDASDAIDRALQDAAAGVLQGAAARVAQKGHVLVAQRATENAHVSETAREVRRGDPGVAAQP